MSTPTLERDTVANVDLTAEKMDIVLRRLDFEITGPRRETFKMDVAACSSSSSSSCGSSQRRPK